MKFDRGYDIGQRFFVSVTLTYDGAGNAQRIGDIAFGVFFHDYFVGFHDRFGNSYIKGDVNCYPVVDNMSMIYKYLVSNAEMQQHGKKRYDESLWARGQEYSDNSFN